jgi:hypothetical protein
MRRNVALVTVIATGLMAVGCETLSLSGQTVKTTFHESDVKECSFLGVVTTHSVMNWPTILRNKAAGLGADVLIIPKAAIGSYSGKAYDCGGRYKKAAP